MVLNILATVVLFGALFYYRVSLFISSLILLAWTVVFGVADLWPAQALVPLTIILIPFNFASMRKSMTSAPMFRGFRKVMLPMSCTEKETIDAGTTWWEGDLFQGKPDRKKLHNYPQPRPTTEEQAFPDGPVKEACRMANDFQITYELADPLSELWAYLKEHRFFAMIIKKEYGGLEFSAYAQSRVLQKLSSVNGIPVITVDVPNSLDPGELLQHYGTDEQKNHHLPRLMCGQEIPCLVLTSPEAGSDAGMTPDTGIVCMGERQGQRVPGMRLTWNKRYTTLALIVTVPGPALKLSDSEKLLGGAEDLGTTCALIPTTTSGVETGRRHFPLNVPSQDGPTCGKDVFVPIDYIIGGPKMAGQGWRMLVECLSVSCGTTLSSNPAGGVKSIALAIGAYARIRRQFRISIGKMEGIEELLARIAGNAYIMDAAASLVAYGITLGEKPVVLSAIARHHCTHHGRQSIIDATDTTGGKGIMLGQSSFPAHVHQDVSIVITAEGASILTRSMVVFGQGVIRCHPYVLEEMEAVKNNDVNAFDQFPSKHIGHVGSNKVRSFRLGLMRGLTSSTPTGDATKRYYQHPNHLGANLALFSDVPMVVLGGSPKHRERISTRLGDILSQLCLASVILKRYDNKGCNEADLPLVHWDVQDALYQAEQAIDGLLQNFPNCVVAGLLNVVIFSTGRHYLAPSDELNHKAAKVLRVPNATRSCIGRGQYPTLSKHNPVGLLEEALTDVIAADPVHQRIYKELGKNLPLTRLDELVRNALAKELIDKDETAILVKVEESRLRSINVDDSDPEELATKPVKLSKKVRKVEAV